VTIVLIGAPGAGKTRVGKRLGPRLGREFIDTDRVVVAEHGAIAGIFAEHGEAHFRRLERQAVAEALTHDAVVALGGGAVLDADTQADLAGATVILLTVSADAVTARIASGKRPLVTSIETWQTLVDSRAGLYASLADYTTDTSDRTIDAIVEELAQWLESNAKLGSDTRLGSGTKLETSTDLE
jgi:shikimate kinase